MPFRACSPTHIRGQTGGVHYTFLGPPISELVHFLRRSNCARKSGWSMPAPFRRPGQRIAGICLVAIVLPAAAMIFAAQQPASPEMLWKKLEPFAQPPEQFAGKFGGYRSPLKFADGSMAKTPADWTRRR